jgi:hypothetical protein
VRLALRVVPRMMGGPFTARFTTRLAASLGGLMQNLIAGALTSVTRYNANASAGVSLCSRLVRVTCTKRQ